MRRSAFTQMMLVFTLIILISAALFLSVFYFSVRDLQFQNTIAALKTQAYDIAYLAGRRRILGAYGSPLETASLQDMMEHKLRSLRQQYAAYCIILDPLGKLSVYADPTLDEREDLAAAFDMQRLLDTLQTVLSGKDVTIQYNGPQGAMFTVAVPWLENGAALGAVYIQTASQTLRAAYEPVALRSLAVFFVAVSLAGLFAYWYSRRFTSPLEEMAQASALIAKGDFSQAVSVEGTAEMQGMAQAFNGMAERLQAIETSRRNFIANLSHELRTPMTNIQGYIQGLLDGAIPTDARQSSLQIVLDETGRLKRLVDGLLALSRAESAETKPAFSTFDIHELIRRVLISRMRQLEDQELAVDLQFDEEALWGRADQDQIAQVLTNLVDNAVKFTPHNGRIVLATRLLSDTQIAVRIADTGPGIAPEDAPHIFERFYKADKSHALQEGTGLGLAICKSILDKHGQSIRYLPDATDGAAFEFTLQKAVPPAAAAMGMP